MNKRPALLQRNIRLLYANSFFGNLAFFLPIMTLFFNQITQSITLVALIFSIQALVSIIFEIPTGAISDIFGRRKVMIFASGLSIVSLIILAISVNFYMLVLFSIIFAFKNTLNSGTQEAVLYDTLKELKKQKQYKNMISRMGILVNIGGMIGAIIGGFLAAYFIRLPFLLSIPIGGLSLVISVLLIEPVYQKTKTRSILRHIKSSGKIMVSNKQLTLLFLYALFSFGIAESSYHLEQIFFAFVNLPVSYFGIVAAIASIFAAFGYFCSPIIARKIGDKKSLITSKILDGFFLTLAAIFLGYISIIFLIIVEFFRSVGFPIQSHLLNQQIKSKNRATILSMNNLMNNIGYIIFAPFIGYLGDLYSITTAFKISGIIIIMSAVFLFFIKSK